MDTVDIRTLTTSDNWADAYCTDPWVDASWWDVPDLKTATAEEAADFKATARIICDGCPVAVLCLTLEAVQPSRKGAVRVGMFGTELDRARNAVKAGVDPADLIGGAR